MLLNQKNNISNIMYKILLFILTFIIVIPMQINIFNFNIKLTLMFILSLSIFSIILILMKKKINKIVVLIFSILVLYTLIFSIISINGFFLDTYILKRLFFACLMFLSIYMLVYLYKVIYKKDFYDEVIRTIIIIGFIHSIVIILTIISIDFRDYLYIYINISELAQKQFEHNIRSNGLFFSGFAILSFFQAIIFIIALVQFSNIKNFKSKYILSIIVLPILFLGIVLTGRTGLIILLFGIVFLLIYNCMFTRIVNVLSTIKIVFFISILFLFLILLLDLEKFKHNIDWAFELFINFFNNKNISSASTEHLFNEMFFLPQNELDILFGIGNFGRNEMLPYINSDSGYILFIHGYGIIGTIFSFFFFLIIFFIVYKSLCPSKLKFFSYFIIISMFIGNIKDFYFLSYNGYTQIFFLIIISAVIYHSKNKEVIKCIHLV